ncbi:MAG: RHS repeat-associated core domain-containing protein [Lachnospiraceae bacterium]|nr:RHS repeat-associated core domain-containing protein [Lachnospiraceae bacterium]
MYEKEGETKQSKEETSYQLGAGIEALQRNQKTYYYHQDEQLNTALITNRNGEIKNRYQYDVFGNGLETIEELPNRIRYTGQQYDQQTEQYYLRARYYNPIVGRFMQEDVYQGDGLNLYAYCKNNPVMHYDPNGYACKNSGEIAGDGNNSGEKSVSKKAMMLREGKNKTIVQVKSFAEADALLKEAFPDYQKVRGIGGRQQELDIKPIRKKYKIESYKKGGTYHKDYTMDKEKKIVYGHEDNPHGKYPHINIKRKDKKEVLINIVFEER